MTEEEKNIIEIMFEKEYEEVVNNNNT